MKQYETKEEKMNKLSKCFLSLIMLTTYTFAGNTSTEDFFYQRGYEIGFSNGFEEGVKQAMAESKKMLNLYGNELKAYEIGKYLIKAQNLTYPQVWQEVDEKGVVKLRIIPSRIQKELNIDEIFSKFTQIPTMNSSAQNKLKLSLEEKNSVYLSNRDSNINALPQSVNSATNQHTLSVKKTSKNLDILKRANVVFSDEGEAYNVLFFTNTEKQDFCKQYEICK